jgi:hypothetical protein
MVDDDDDDMRAAEQLRSLGLLHLRDKPEELKKALARLVEERKRFEKAEELERQKIRERFLKGEPPPAPKAPPPPTTTKAPAKKTSTLYVTTRSPGTCATCRHANQGTADFDEGRVLCWVDKRTKQITQTCDVTMALPRTSGQPVAAWSTYHLYQPYDGENGTYEKSTDTRILAEDADAKLRAAQRADEPVIERT